MAYIYNFAKYKNFFLDAFSLLNSRYCIIDDGVQNRFFYGLNDFISSYKTADFHSVSRIIDYFVSIKAKYIQNEFDADRIMSLISYIDNVQVSLKEPSELQLDLDTSVKFYINIEKNDVYTIRYLKTYYKETDDIFQICKLVLYKKLEQGYNHKQITNLFQSIDEKVKKLPFNIKDWPIVFCKEDYYFVFTLDKSITKSISFLDIGIEMLKRNQTKMKEIYLCLSHNTYFVNSVIVRNLINEYHFLEDFTRLPKISFEKQVKKDCKFISCEVFKSKWKELPDDIKYSPFILWKYLSIVYRTPDFDITIPDKYICVDKPKEEKSNNRRNITPTNVIFDRLSIFNQTENYYMILCRKYE